MGIVLLLPCYLRSSGTGGHTMYASSACEGVESPASLMIRDSGQAQVDRQMTCIGNMAGNFLGGPTGRGGHLPNGLAGR